MALFDDLIQAAGGAAQVASGIGALQQGGVGAQLRLPPALPSSAELANIQLQNALNIANLQSAGLDVTTGLGGELTLTPRLTPSEITAQQLSGAGAGLQRELANIGIQPSTGLGSQLNTASLAATRGAPQVNRAALIQAIQQKRGPATSLGLQAPAPSPVSVGPLSTVTPTTNIPSLSQLSQQPTGNFLSRNILPIAGIAGGIGLASRLGLFNPLISGAQNLFSGGIPSAESLFGFSPTFPEMEAIGNAGSGLGSFDFSSLANVAGPDEFIELPLAGPSFGFADLFE